jgi:hypothetical protein
MRIPLGAGLGGLVARTGKSAFTADYGSDERLVLSPVRSASAVEAWRTKSRISEGGTPKAALFVDAVAESMLIVWNGLERVGA